MDLLSEDDLEEVAADHERDREGGTDQDDERDPEGEEKHECLQGDESVSDPMPRERNREQKGCDSLGIG